MVEPRVSVVVIFLDAARFLAEAIASARAQTMGSWELLLVDDGSRDGSGEIARTAAAEDPTRIRYLTHEGSVNRGMSASRNLGIAHSRGEFLAFLDGDDVWLPDRLKHHLALLEQHPDCALVCGPTRLWFEWVAGDSGASAPPRGDSIRALGLDTGTIDAPQYLIRVLDEQAKTPAMCSFTARTSMVRTVGGFEEDFPGMFEDQVFLTKLLLRYRVVVTGECLDLYRQHPGSACYQARLQGHYHGSIHNPEQRAFIERVQRFVGELPNHPAELDRAVERWRQRYRSPLRARLADLFRDPRRALRISLRTLASRVLPDRLYRRLWARAQGFDLRHEEPPGS